MCFAVVVFTDGVSVCQLQCYEWKDIKVAQTLLFRHSGSKLSRYRQSISINLILLRQLPNGIEKSIGQLRKSSTLYSASRADAVLCQDRALSSFQTIRVLLSTPPRNEKLFSNFCVVYGPTAGLEFSYTWRHFRVGSKYFFAH